LAINFSGEFTTPRSPEEVFDFLSDPNRFGPLLPDFQSMSMQDPTHFTVKVKVGVGNIRGSAELKMELSEAVKPLRAQYKGQGSAVGSQVTVSAGFDLTALPEGTKVVWKGETSVFGKLASMAGGLLEPLGRKNIQKLIEGLQKALSGPAMLPTTQAPPTGSDIVGLPQSQTTSSSTDLAPPTVPVEEASSISPANPEPHQGPASGAEQDGHAGLKNESSKGSSSPQCDTNPAQDGRLG
jgi:carbon monoxide dehydrogenase subunit G